MAFFAIWVLWLAFIVHKWRIFDGFPINNISTHEGLDMSNRIHEKAPLQWGEWQRQTFKWWPSVLSEFNISLTGRGIRGVVSIKLNLGRYITFLPPIVLNVKVNFIISIQGKNS